MSVNAVEIAVYKMATIFRKWSTVFLSKKVLRTKTVASVSLTIYLRLTHWGRVTHICDSNLTIIGPDNGLSPDRRQAIIWTNAGVLLIGPWGTNFSEISIDIHTFSFKKINLKMSSAKWRPFCLGLNVLKSSPKAMSWVSYHIRYSRWVYLLISVLKHLLVKLP